MKTDAANYVETGNDYENFRDAIRKSIATRVII